MDKKIIDYKVVYGSPNSEYGSVDDAVKSAIKQGWQPQGGIAYEPGTGRPSQAMVLYED